jgi:hypothetical protein
MLREEECVMNEEIGVLHSGKRFRLNKKRIVAEREGKHGEIEERDTRVIFQIEGVCTKRKYMSTLFSRRGSHCRSNSASNPRPHVRRQELR